MCDAMTNRLRDRKAGLELEEVEFTLEERRYLRGLVQSYKFADRRYVVDVIRNNWRPPANHKLVIPLMELLIPHPRDEIRWGACVDLGFYAPDHPELIWPVVERWGYSRNADIRAAIGCSLLEEVVMDHFEEYFPRACARAEASERFYDTFMYCEDWAWTDDPDCERRRFDWFEQYERRKEEAELERKYSQPCVDERGERAACESSRKWNREWLEKRWRATLFPTDEDKAQQEEQRKHWLAELAANPRALDIESRSRRKRKR